MPSFPPETKTISADEMRELGSSFLDPSPDVLQQLFIILILKHLTDPVSEECIATADPKEA